MDKIKRFCKNPNKLLFYSFSDTITNLFVKYADMCVKGNVGNVKLAKDILLWHMDRDEEDKYIEEDKYNFNEGILKVLKQVHPEIDDEMSDVSLILFNDLINKIGSKITHISFSLKKVTSNDVKKAVTTVLGFGKGQLLEYALKEGNKAVTRFKHAVKGGDDVTKYNEYEQLAAVQFSLSVTKNLFEKYKINADITAVIFLAAVLEYLSSEILELSGNNARDFNRYKIYVNDIITAIKLDEELNKIIVDELKFNMNKYAEDELRERIRLGLENRGITDEQIEEILREFENKEDYENEVLREVLIEIGIDKEDDDYTSE